MTTYTVTRKIEIDTAHRITTHMSKCRHIHGHRYVIEATCKADMLVTSGAETDMVLDFSFIKQEMIKIIEKPCDHGFIISLQDRELLMRMAPEGADPEDWLKHIAADVRQNGFHATTESFLQTRLYIVPFQSTAECLARHWYDRLKEVINCINDSNVMLESVTVWETPNCFACYRD